jgi:putative flippase GtrA
MVNGSGMNASNPNPSTPVIVGFSGSLAFLAFALTKVATVKLDLPPNPNFEIFTGVITILFGIGFCIFALRKRDHTASFAKLFVAGWMSTLWMGLQTVVFYQLAFEWLSGEAPPEGFISAVLLKYNAFGMMFAVLLGFIFKKK